MWPTLLSVWSTATEKKTIFQLDDQLAARKKKIAAETVIVETPFNKVINASAAVAFEPFPNIQFFISLYWDRRIDSVKPVSFGVCAQSKLATPKFDLQHLIFCFPCFMFSVHQSYWYVQYSMYVRSLITFSTSSSSCVIFYLDTNLSMSHQLCLRWDYKI